MWPAATSLARCKYLVSITRWQSTRYISLGPRLGLVLGLGLGQGLEEGYVMGYV